MTETKRRLTPKDWLEIVSLVKEGVPVPELAVKYKRSPQAIYAGLKARRVDLNLISARIAREENERTKVEVLKKIKDTKNNDYKMVVFLQQKAMKIVVDSSKEESPEHALSRSQSDLKSIQIAMNVVTSGTAAKWKILGLDQENADADIVLPELPIRDMTGAELQALRKRQAEEAAGIYPDEEEYSREAMDELIDEEIDKVEEGMEEDE